MTKTLTRMSVVSIRVLTSVVILNVISTAATVQTVRLCAKVRLQLSEIEKKMSPELWLMTLLLLKHWFCDFYFQRRYQYLNKGKYGHFGGILHAIITMYGTIMAVAIFYWNTTLAETPSTLIISMVVLEGLIHYHMDWLKIKINTLMWWGPTTHEEFWWLLGVDQTVHLLNYILIVAVLL